MSTMDEINNALGKYAAHTFDPAEYLDQCIDLFDKAFDKGAEYDPRIQKKAEKGSNDCGTVALTFERNGHPFAASKLLIHVWNRFGLIQREERRRVYRAGVAMYLAMLYRNQGDSGAALRWALCTHADDMLGEHEKGGGRGKQMLLTELGASSDALTQLDGIATQDVTSVRSVHEGDWSVAPGFAEDVIVRFAVEKPEFAHLFAQDSRVEEFPLSQAYFTALLDAIDADHRNATAKGDSLEHLASYLFLLIPGWVPRRKVRDEYGSSEIDLVVSNLTRTSNLTAELLGGHFLAECKNWEDRVGVEKVGVFLYRMRLTHARFGVIFAKSGITGGEGETASRRLIRDAFHEDGSICVVLDRKDLESLAGGGVRFWPMLLEHIERVRFGRPRGAAE